MSDSVKKWYEMKEEGWWTKNPENQKQYIHMLTYGCWTLKTVKYTVITNGILTYVLLKNLLKQ